MLSDMGSGHQQRNNCDVPCCLYVVRRHRCGPSIVRWWELDGSGGECEKNIRTERNECDGSDGNHRMGDSVKFLTNQSQKRPTDSEMAVSFQPARGRTTKVQRLRRGRGGGDGRSKHQETIAKLAGTGGWSGQDEPHKAVGVWGRRTAA